MYFNCVWHFDFPFFFLLWGRIPCGLSGRCEIDRRNFGGYSAPAWPRGGPLEKSAYVYHLQFFLVNFMLIPLFVADNTVMINGNGKKIYLTLSLQ
jgi:hypothetical protein